MTKEDEFIEKYSGDVMMRGVMERDLKSVISEAITEHDAKQDHTLDDFIDEVNRMRQLYFNGKYTLSDGVKNKLITNMDSIQDLAFSEPYREGGEV